MLLTYYNRPNLVCASHVSQALPWWLLKREGAYEKNKVCCITKFYLKLNKTKCIEFKM